MNTATFNDSNFEMTSFYQNLVLITVVNPLLLEN